MRARLKRFGPEPYGMKTAHLSLKVRTYTADMIETLFYGCVAWTLGAQHLAWLRSGSRVHVDRNPRRQITPQYFRSGGCSCVSGLSHSFARLQRKAASLCVPGVRVLSLMLGLQLILTCFRILSYQVLYVQ